MHGVPHFGRPGMEGLFIAFCRRGEGPDEVFDLVWKRGEAGEGRWWCGGGCWGRLVVRAAMAVVREGRSVVGGGWLVVGEDIMVVLKRTTLFVLCGIVRRSLGGLEHGVVVVWQFWVLGWGRVGC